MKKKLSLAILSAVLALVIVLCAGCAKGQKALDSLQQTYAKVSDATKIEVSVETKNKNLVQYSSNTVYNKTDSGYSWTKTSKKINEINEHTTEPYTETTENGIESVTSNFLPNLKLDEQYFVTGYEASKKSLNATVKGGSEKDVIGYSQILLTSISGMNITMQVVKNHVGNLAITFVSNEFNVTIDIVFTY